MIDSVVAVPPGQPLTFLPVDEQCTASGFDGQVAAVCVCVCGRGMRGDGSSRVV